MYESYFKNVLNIQFKVKVRIVRRTLKTVFCYIMQIFTYNIKPITKN